MGHLVCRLFPHPRQADSLYVLTNLFMQPKSVTGFAALCYSLESWSVSTAACFSRLVSSLSLPRSSLFRVCLCSVFVCFSIQLLSDGMQRSKDLLHTLIDWCCTEHVSKLINNSSNALSLCWQGGSSLALRGQQGAGARPESMLSWPAAWV